MLFTVARAYTHTYFGTIIDMVFAKVFTKNLENSEKPQASYTRFFYRYVGVYDSMYVCIFYMCV